VTDSEISKVETGSQDCRLETFIRLSQALGRPPAEVLDEVFHFASIPNEFAEIVSRDEEFAVLVTQYEVRPNKVPLFAAFIGAWCNHVDTLTRCSNAEREWRRVTPQIAAIREPMLRFAKFADSSLTPKSRTELQRDLRIRPISQLRNLGLLDEAALHQCVEMLEPPPETKREINLTNVSDGNTTAVMISWSQLRARLVKAAKRRGVKVALADVCGVSRQAVTTWLKGTVEPGAESFRKLAEWDEKHS
jgi:transcriptional regulator with XRE-family HTH domain